MTSRILAAALPCRRARVLAGLLTLLATGCYPKTAAIPGPVTEAALAAAGGHPSAKAVAHGRELFAAQCGECHGHPDVTALTEAEWRRVVPRMAGKADLSEADGQDVLDFVLAARGR